MEIQKCMRRVSCPDPLLFWTLLDAQIEPILTYAAEVWGLEDVCQIEKVAYRRLVWTDFCAFLCILQIRFCTERQAHIPIIY